MDYLSVNLCFAKMGGAAWTRPVGASAKVTVCASVQAMGELPNVPFPSGRRRRPRCVRVPLGGQIIDGGRICGVRSELARCTVALFAL